MKLLVRFGWLVVLLTAVGCQSGPNEPPLSERKIRAVTTTGMITDLVEHVGGDRVKVEGLMGPGVDPHLYKTSAGDLKKMQKADVIFYNGLHLEGQMGEVFERMGKRVKTVAITDKLDPRTDLRQAPEGFEGTHDPHVWFDVALWMKTADRVRDALIELDPEHADEYRANHKKYTEELAKLNEYVKEQAARVPSDQRVLITAHDAFYYFGRAYGFEVHGLQGVSTATEAGVADVQKLVRLIADRRIPAIFVEDSVPEETIKAVQEAVAARGFKVQIGGKLYSDSMGTAGTPEGTYPGMVRHNIDTIVRALLREDGR